MGSPSGRASATSTPGIVHRRHARIRAGQPALEQPEGQEQEQRDIGAVEKGPDDGPAEDDEEPGQQALARPGEAGGRRSDASSTEAT